MPSTLERPLGMERRVVGVGWGMRDIGDKHWARRRGPEDGAR